MKVFANYEEPITKMDNNKCITRKSKVLMYLHDYYFGNKLIYSLIIFISPLFVTVASCSLLFFELMSAKVIGGIGIFLGIYLLIEPFYLLLLNWDSNRTNCFSIEVDNEGIRFFNASFNSEVKYQYFKKIKKSYYYYAFVINNSEKLFIPFSMLDKSQRLILDNQSDLNK